MNAIPILILHHAVTGFFAAYQLCRILMAGKVVICEAIQVCTGPDFQDVCRQIVERNAVPDQVPFVQVSPNSAAGRVILRHLCLEADPEEREP